MKMHFIRDAVATAFRLPPERVRVIAPYVGGGFGSKGIGELGIVGTAAAIANAVYHATGIRVRDLPITLDNPKGFFSRLSTSILTSSLMNGLVV